MFTVMLLCIINTSAEGASTRCSIVQNLDIIGGIKRGASQTWNQIHFFSFQSCFWFQEVSSFQSVATSPSV